MIGDDAILLYNGKAVKRTPLGTVVFGNSGCLVAFTIGTISYRYYNVHKFLKKHRDNMFYKNVLTGYYQEDSFRSYRRGTLNVNDLINEKNPHKYKKWEYAEVDDIVEVKKLRPGFDSTMNTFSQYYTRAFYRFKVSDPYKVYKRVTDFPPLGVETNENNANYSIVTEEFVDLSTTSSGLFYAKNFGDFIDTDPHSLDELSIDETLSFSSSLYDENNYSKYCLAYYMTLICWKIKRIKTDILPKFAIESLSTIEDYAAYELGITGSNPQYAALLPIDKVVAELLRSWGVLAERSNTDTNLSPIDFDPILPNNPLSYSEIVDYYKALQVFYENAFYLNEDEIFKTNGSSPVDKIGRVLTTSEDSNRRLVKLFEILPESAIVTLPVSYRLEWIDSFIKTSYISDSEAFIQNVDTQHFNYSTDFEVEKRKSHERILIKILISFIGTSDVQELLDYLLSKNVEKTKFEILYYKLEDDHEDEIPIVNWFTDKVTNRKKYVKAVYELWKESIYNPLFIPSGTIANSDNLNPNCYWFTPEGLDYFEFNSSETKPTGILNFSTDTITELTNTMVIVNKTSNITYFSGQEINGEELSIGRYETITRVYVNEAGEQILPLIDDLPPTYENYHIFQPLSTIGYQENLDLQVPDMATIPAFLFFYAEEFDALNDYYALISFGVEVAIEIGLFALFGGVTSLKNIRYLKYVTKAGRATLSSSASGAPLVWAGIEGMASTLSMAASNMYAINNFLANTTNNSADLALYENQRNVFGYLTLGFGVTSGISQLAVVKSCKKLVTQIDALPAGTSYTIDPDLEILVRQIGSLNVLYSAMNSKLIAATGASSDIVYKFGQLTDDLKLSFYGDFIKYDNDFFVSINALNNASGVDHWQTLKLLNLPERTLANILLDSDLILSYSKCFNGGVLETKLYNLSITKRIEFVSVFRNVPITDIQRLENHSILVDRWFLFKQDKRTEIVNNIDIWLKNEEVKSIILSGDYATAASLYGKSLEPSILLSSHFGVKYAYTDELIGTLNDAAVIANRTDDVLLISQNLGIPEYIVEIAKDNYFKRERLMLVSKPIIGDLNNTVISYGRYSKEPNDILEWEAAIANNFANHSKLRIRNLIAHEYIEFKLIEDYGMNFNSFVGLSNMKPYDLAAHQISPRMGPLNGSMYASVGLIDNAILEVSENFSNIDAVVLSIVKKYKLN